MTRRLRAQVRPLLHVSVKLTEGYPKKSLNKEIVGSITCTRLLSVNGQMSVSFRSVSDF